MILLTNFRNTPFPWLPLCSPFLDPLLLLWPFSQVPLWIFLWPSFKCCCVSGFHPKFSSHSMCTLEVFQSLPFFFFLFVILITPKSIYQLSLLSFKPLYLSVLQGPLKLKSSVSPQKPTPLLMFPILVTFSFPSPLKSTRLLFSPFNCPFSLSCYLS